ncbi:MAG: pyridoxal phosphate-dependent aminotransferase [Calditrichia bacterium]|nr:pyridoxal phosphate-dependent aminotransferase [Calditrichia bacterium]
MLVSKQIETYISTQSWIRKMFGAAFELKKEYGSENVFDFGLGNPDLPPPKQIGGVLKNIIEMANTPKVFGYVPNAGLPDTRTAVAKFVSSEQHTEITSDHVVLTNGAAGALNILFRTILEPGDEIICPAPYFVEYKFYCDNFGGKFVPVNSTKDTFELDFAAIEAAINENTRALIINSPNNPTGQIYSQTELEKLSKILTEYSNKYNRPILLISDEPYRFLAYDNSVVPPILPVYPNSIIINSFSKSLSLAGVRIGYIIVNPEIEESLTLIQGLSLANRILGFVNAPIIGQHLITHLLGSHVDTDIYLQRRNALAKILKKAGFSFTIPKGAFYFFPKTPEGYDDIEFIELLMTEKIIAVPGIGFGFPGHFRLAYCIEQKVIEKSEEAFKRVMNHVRRNNEKRTSFRK